MSHEARLAAVPWHALQGLAAQLEAPLAEVLDGAPAEKVLDRFLRANKGFTAEQRTVSAESLFGVGLWRRRLAFGLERPAPLTLLGVLLRELAGRSDAQALVGRTLANPSTPTALEDVWSWPDWLGAELRSVLPAQELEAAARAFAVPGPVTLRVNRARTTREALAESLAADGITTRPGTLAPDALVVTSHRPNLLGTKASHDGLFEVQDEGSQVLGTLVDAQPGEEVLDLCAGAGGKTLQLLALGATVHATDVDLPRLERLRTRTFRAQLHAVRIHGALPPESLRVPKVLVDAPCSELGALRRGPDLRWRLEPEDFASLPALQRELLERGLLHLAPKGRLVYATCTFRQVENEGVASPFERAHPELRRVQTLELWPHRDGTDGFFAAVWERG